MNVRSLFFLDPVFSSESLASRANISCSGLRRGRAVQGESHPGVLLCAIVKGAEGGGGRSIVRPHPLGCLSMGVCCPSSVFVGRGDRPVASCDRLLLVANQLLERSLNMLPLFSGGFNSPCSYESFGGACWEGSLVLGRVNAHQRDPCSDPWCADDWYEYTSDRRAVDGLRVAVCSPSGSSEGEGGSSKAHAL